MGDKAETKIVADDIPQAELITTYLELKSAYKVAEKYNVSATAVKRLLKEAGVLRTQSVAATERNLADPHCGKYTRSEEHKKNLSDLGKPKIGDKNPFFNKKHKEETKVFLSAVAKKRTSDRNPNYKHGETVRRPRDFRLSEFKPVRNRVFNRDDYTCYYCRVKGGHLHAHHILPYWFCKEGFLDLDNLITVCSNCHFELAHKGDWSKFDTTPITESLLSKYPSCRERLSELTSYMEGATV